MKHKDGYNFGTRSDRTHVHFHCFRAFCSFLKWLPYVMIHPVYWYSRGNLTKSLSRRWNTCELKRPLTSSNNIAPRTRFSRFPTRRISRNFEQPRWKITFAIEQHRFQRASTALTKDARKPWRGRNAKKAGIINTRSTSSRRET